MHLLAKEFQPIAGTNPAREMCQRLHIINKKNSNKKVKNYPSIVGASNIIFFLYLS